MDMAEATDGQQADSGPSLRLALSLALIGGMVGGALEVTARSYRVAVDGRFETLTRQSLWSIPLVLTVLGMIFITILWAIGRGWRPLGRWSTLAGFAAGWAVLSPMLVFRDSFHWAAVTVLATGIGVQTGRWAGMRSPDPRRLTRVFAPLVTAVVVLGVGGAWLWERHERITPRAPGAELPADAPNVLLLILDTVRASSLSLYGYPLPTTPYLEELARRGVVFDMAISPAPWTLPSHASMFTGRWPNEMHADWLAPLEQEQTTLAEVLASRGYRTGGFTANLLATSAGSGLGQGFEHYEDIPLQLAVLVRSTAIGFQLFNPFIVWRLEGQRVGRKPAALVRRAFLDWVGRGRGEPPFFAFLNFFDAHRPYDPAPGFLGRFGPVTANSERLLGALNSEGNRLTRDSAWIAERGTRYAEAIASIDEEIRGMLAELESRGLLENTVLVVTADHGELVGEHGLFGHGHSLYLDEIRVPLLVVPPHGLPQGRRVAQPVSLRHIARTITDLARIETAELGGASLRPMWERDSTVAPEPVFSMVSQVPDRYSKAPVARGNMAALLDGPWHYILNGDSTVELYHYQTDYAEMIPLQEQAPPDTVRRLESVLWSVWNGKASLAAPLKEGSTIALGPVPGSSGPVSPDALHDAVLALSVRRPDPDSF